MYLAATVYNHAKLTNLSYAAAGHTGFEPTIAAGTVADYWRGDKTWQALPAATPGGSDGQMQYNNGGVFGGAAGFTYDDATGQVAFTLQADVASGNAYSFAGADAGELTAASGVQPFVSVTPRIRHTGTASWIGLYVNPTVISSGSGAQVAAAFMGGNVGIGTTGPTSKLHVLENSEGVGQKLVFSGRTDATDKLPAIQLSDGTTGRSVLGLRTGDIAVDNNGNVGIGTTGPVISGTGKLHMSANTFRLDTARTPASAAAAGNAGEFCWDASYLYVCIAAATWRRLAHNTW